MPTWASYDGLLPKAWRLEFASRTLGPYYLGTHGTTEFWGVVGGVVWHVFVRHGQGLEPKELPWSLKNRPPTCVVLM